MRKRTITILHGKLNINGDTLFTFASPIKELIRLLIQGVVDPETTARLEVDYGQTPYTWILPPGMFEPDLDRPLLSGLAFRIRDTELPVYEDAVRHNRPIPNWVANQIAYAFDPETEQLAVQQPPGLGLAKFARNFAELLRQKGDPRAEVGRIVVNWKTKELADAALADLKIEVATFFLVAPNLPDDREMYRELEKMIKRNRAHRVDTTLRGNDLSHDYEVREGMDMSEDGYTRGWRLSGRYRSTGKPFRMTSDEATDSEREMVAAESPDEARKAVISRLQKWLRL